jgi:CheY-like chemotaxis protein
MPTALGSSPTILVVDDEPAVVNLVKLILEAAGYRVLAACDGQQALALFDNRSQSIDLLLTDINMPNVSGLQLACGVSETAPGLPVIFMTGCPAESPLIDFLRREGPFSDCTVIRKPFTPPQLLGQISGILSAAPR